MFVQKEGDFRPKEGERETGPKRERLEGDLTGLPTPRNQSRGGGREMCACFFVSIPYPQAQPTSLPAGSWWPVEIGYLSV